ncbi:MAG: threo-3-hydroxy-L-aspartate ammonia-lyase [Armatimonadetes bacterium]|nr:threo-3-hydroxy-L-aspartate ammonia-lyase [Armatimonadota bacterium]
MPVTLDDVRSAASVLAGQAHRTPVHTSRTLDDLCGAQVFLKCENFQRSGAFKFRGAFHALSRLDEDRRRRGVLTFSSGNHAQALALAGRILDVPVTIVMPTDAPEVKRRATEGYGGEVVLYDRDETTREALGARIAEERGLAVVPPYDHPDIVAGQGTVALELFEDGLDLDALVVPCGGGGLLSGCAVATKGLSPGTQVVGAEPAQADDAARTFATGVLQRADNPETIADGARTPSLGTVTFELVLRHVDAFVTVSEEEILRATKLLWERCKLVVEPTGALALAAVLQGGFAGRRIGVVLSGGNADVAVLGRLRASVD